MKESIVGLALAPGLVLAALTIAQPVEAAEATETSQAYIEKHIQAIGGRERLLEVKSEVLEFEAQEGGQAFDLEIDLKAGHKVLLKASLPSGFRIQQGSAGDGIWWRQDPEGVREFNRPKDALEFQELSLCLDPTAPLDLERHAESLKLLGPQKLAGMECQVIESQLSKDLSIQLWFDLKTGLLVKAGQSGLEDYRLEQGIKIPHVLRKSGDAIMKVKSVKFNVPLPDGLFSKPAGTGPASNPDGSPAMATSVNPGSQPGIVRRPPPAVFGKGALPSLPHYQPSSPNPFQVDLRSSDLTKLDVASRLADLLHADFDSKTRWPGSLPAGFAPNEIMESGKNPGLGVRELHRRGITGKGVSIGIIDQTLLVDHIEYKDRLRSYEEIHSPAGAPAQMHGPAVASIAVGETCGVAPEADLYYIAETHGTVEQGKFNWDFTSLAQSIDRLLEMSQALPKDRRIRVISISVGWSPGQKGCAETDAAVQRAKDAGVFVISTALERTHHLRFHGLGRESTRNPDELSSYGLGSWWANSFRNGQQRFIPGERLLVPMDSRTTASPTGTNDYVFYSNGGWSWCVPYLAGIYALACQANPDITPEEFWSAAMKTGRTTTIEVEAKPVDLGTILDPGALINSLRRGS